MPAFFRSVPALALLAILALLALQAFPLPGVILMMFGAAFLVGLLVHVFLIGLLIEAFMGRVPRALVALPVTAYAGYYALYTYQAVEIRQKSAQLQQENSGKIFDFDPGVYSLVTPDAEKLASEYAIPVVYQTNKNFTPESHVSFRLLRRDQCDMTAEDSRHRIAKSFVRFGNTFQNSVCLLRFPADPPSKVITVVKHGDEEVWKRKWNVFGEQVTEVLVDGKVAGSFKTASIWRLPILPIAAIGCALDSGAAAWRCFADFARSPVEIDTIPATVDHAKFGSPESVMLGIPRYTSADLARFTGYKQNDETLVRVAGEPKRIENESFAGLQRIVDGENPTLPAGFGFSLTRDPQRLAPFAEPMANRLRQLVKNERGTQDRDQINALDAALSALPDPAFAPVSDTIFEIIRQQSESWKRFSLLYLRAAESGVKTLAFYQAHFISEEVNGYMRILPILAICRVGQADPEIIAEMKRRYIAATSDDRYQSALLVTLAKLGEEAFVRSNAPTKVGGNYKGWAQAVLSGSGKTKVGPNNCMAKEWGYGELPAVLSPTLGLYRGEWKAQGRT
jgi:hypothetical protein